MPGKAYSAEEDQYIRDGLKAGKNWGEIADGMPGRNREGIRQYARNRVGRELREGIRSSPYPSYDDPLVWQGDALVLPDPEFPFQHSRWINQCVELAKAWDIRHLIIAGDMLHMQSLAAFEPPWTEESIAEWAGSNFTLEMKVSRKLIAELVDGFESVDLIMGNHEGRMLRAIGSVLTPDTLLRLLSIEKIRSAPYYYMRVESAGVPFLIEHPRSTAKYAPGALADKYQAHVLMAHSHKIGMVASRSGQWYGWHIGCAVDEEKLAYAAQRHNAGEAHKLGAAIVRNGVAYPLFDGWVDWEWLASLAP